MEQTHYVGLDVSQEMTSVCVIDEQVLWFGAANVPLIPTVSLQAFVGTHRTLCVLASKRA